MARPTSLIVEHQGPEVDAKAKVGTAPAKHADALLDAYATLQAFHDAGAFDVLRGFAGAHKQIMAQLAAAANEPEMIRGLRNLLMLVRLLENIEPEKLEAIITGIAKAMQSADAPGDKTPGSFSLLQRTRHKDTRRALGLAVDVAESIGRELAKKDGAGER